MSRYNHHQSAFKNGMISPKLYGRTDIDEYQYSAKKILNFLISSNGGAFSRPGTVSQIALTSKCCVFAWERSDGNYYIVYTPGTVALGDIGFKAYDGNWTPKTCFPSLDQIQNWGTTTNLPTHDQLISFQSNTEANFDDLDIHGFTSVVIENALVITHNSGLIPPLTFKILSVGGGVRIEQYQFSSQLSVLTTTSGNFYSSTDLPTAWLTTPYYINRDSNVWLGSSVAVPGGQEGLQTSAHVTTTLTSYAGNTAATTNFFTADMKWTFLVLNQADKEGVYFITSVNSATSATAIVIFYGKDAVTKSSKFRTQLFRPSLGFPKLTSVFNNRMILANTATKPNWFFASRTNNYKELLGFQLFQFIATSPITEASSFELPLTSKAYSEIKWISQQNDLLMGTSREEFVLAQGEDALSIMNIGIAPQSAIGSAFVPAVKTSEAVFFVSANGKTIRQIQYNFDVRGYRSKNLSILNPDLIFTLREGQEVDSIADIQIIKIAWQESNRTLWALTNTDNLFSLCIEPNSETVAWAYHQSEGAIEDIFTFFSRTINADTLGIVADRTSAHWVEFMAPEYLNDDLETESLNISDLPVFMDSSALIYPPATQESFSCRVTAPSTVDLNPFFAGFNQMYPTGRKFEITASTNVSIGPDDANLQVGDFVYLINSYQGYGVPSLKWATSYANAIAGIANVSATVTDITVKDVEVGVAITKWGKFTQYANKTIDVIGDGVLYEGIVVDADGFFTLPIAVKKVIFGMYYPAELETLPPDYAGSFGSSQGSINRVERAFVRYYRSRCGEIGTTESNLEPIAFPGELPYSGSIAHVNPGGPDREFSLILKKDKSLPLNVMCVTLRGQVNE